MIWKRIVRVSVSMLGAVLIFSGMADAGYAAKEDTVTVFAAASTTNAVTEIGKLFVKQALGGVRPSFAASSTLAKQIENGAPAAVYVSANKKWMDYLEEKDLIDPASRYDLLKNRIVLVAPVGSPLAEVEIVPNFRLDELLDGGYLAMGDPDHVPAGIYGKQALEALGVWDEVSNRIARQKDIRSALALVERGEVSLGLVYVTDAAISNKVRVVGIFPENSHQPIVYPVALVKESGTPAAKRFMEYLRSATARAIFEKYGFIVP